MIQIAYFSLVFALFCAGYVVLAASVGLRTRRQVWLMSAANAIAALAGLLTLAVVLLWFFLFQRDLRLVYVASFTNLSLSPLYVFSALWAGQEGSLLFWGWLLSLAGFSIVRTLRRTDAGNEAWPYVMMVSACTIGFFLIMLVGAANPFQQLAVVPNDGQSLNPLLQNIYMALHPPFLFLGYAGFFVPFVLAFAALCAGRTPPGWLVIMRRWTVWAWYLLGLGILLGARWAYLELGWGGYWNWDPVENASFLPWMTSTALLHTLILQQRRGWLPRWNLFMCLLLFTLCIFGTFITRSGVLESVHAFAQSSIGGYLIAGLLLIGLSAAGLFVARWRKFQSQISFPAFFSKENSVLLANQLFIGLTFAVLYGTVYPLLSNVLWGKAASIGPPFFNLIAKILGVALLALTGYCQHVSWQPMGWPELRKKFVIPLIIAGGGTITLITQGIRVSLVLLTCALSLFMLTASGKAFIHHVYTSVTARPAVMPVWTTLFRQRRQAASYLFHAGVAMMLIGIVVSATYQREQDISLQPGEFIQFGAYRLRYVQVGQRERPQEQAVFAEIELYRGERRLGIVRPERRFYGEQQETTEIGLHASLREDLYIILNSLEDNRTATFTVILNPLLSWFWVGGFLVFTAGILLLL